MNMRQQLPPHAMDAAAVLRELGVEAQAGLSEREAAARLHRHGPNRIRRASRRSVWKILIDQFMSVVIAVLAAAAFLAFLFAEYPEALAIVAVLFINGTLGFVSEWRAVRSMEALQRLTTPNARVRRSGKEKRILVHRLVPGDVVIIEGGDLVPADIRLLEANNLVVEEAVLTGESVPAGKRVDAAGADSPLAERQNMLFSGTTVTQGSALGVVTATGMETELGHIAELVEGAKDESTPLEERLNRLGRRLALASVAVAVVVAAAGLAAGQPARLMIETAIALGVAAVPEGLPIVATIALARGMWVMARRNALINRLNAVETLGATRVIFTDKTGTLTENQMTLKVVITPKGEHTFEAGEHGIPRLAEGDGRDPMLRRLIQAGVLCNNASVEGDGAGDAHGDPTEVALLRAGIGLGLGRPELLREMKELKEVSFDPERMMMATYHESGDGLQVMVKGAPKAVLGVCGRVIAEGGDRALADEDREKWQQLAGERAGEGLRLLAMADKSVNDVDEEPYEGLRWLGLVGLFDPPRQGVRESIEACKRAGIRVVMVTGDLPETAASIGRMVGLGEGEVVHGADLRDPAAMSVQERRRALDGSIFARVNPAQKLDLVRLFQEGGEVVAMTGDGVNDAPALKTADIGVAMGRRGTDAAREAADMVLRDDSFSSIVSAVEQGRVIFENIRKSVMFMLCTNVAEVLAVTLASLANAPLPLLPLQILYLNVVTDIFPALALGAGAGRAGIMAEPPRPPHEPVLTNSHWRAIAGWSLLIALSVLGAMFAALSYLELPVTTAVTVSFMTLAFAKLWFVFNLRAPGSSILDNDIVSNRWIWAAIALCILLLAVAVYQPLIAGVLQTEPLHAREWMLVAAMSLLPLLAGQTLRAVQHRQGRKTPGNGA